MTDQEKFEAFKRRVVDEIETQYGSELREKYSVEEVDRAQNCILSLTESEYNDWQALGEEICAKLEDAVSAKADPQGEKGRQIAQLHRRWLSYSWEAYTPQVHCGLAQLYTADPRFTAYYDRKRSGCAAFLRDAVCAHMK